MHIPEKVPGLKAATAVMGVYAAVWIGLEGGVWRAAVMGVGSTAILLGYGWQKWAGGSILNPGKWMTSTAVTGMCFGLGSSLFTLAFMILKTGLHAHGPEFSVEELNWIIRQIPIWTAAGFLAGFGFGMVALKR